MVQVKYTTQTIKRTSPILSLYCHTQMLRISSLLFLSMIRFLSWLDISSQTQTGSWICIWHKQPKSQKTLHLHRKWLLIKTNGKWLNKAWMSSISHILSARSSSSTLSYLTSTLWVSKTNSNSGNKTIFGSNTASPRSIGFSTKSFSNKIPCPGLIYQNKRRTKFLLIVWSNKNCPILTKSTSSGFWTTI